MKRLQHLATILLALSLMGASECEQFPNPAPSQPLKNYAVLGNGWSANGAPQHEIDYAVSAFAGVQDFRADSAQALVENGIGFVLKYRHGVGACPETGAVETQEIFYKAQGMAPGYTKDIRMPTLEGGVMIHDQAGFHLIDVVTPENRAIFRQILRESLEPFLTGPDAFQGAFLDVAGPHLPDSFDGQTPNPPGGYSKEAEQDGWVEVYGGLQEDFPDKLILINAHKPWEPRQPVDFTGIGLALRARVGIMSESRMMTFGSISGWTPETIYDVGAMTDVGLPVIVTHSLEDTSPSLPEQRYWGLATYLLATGDAPNVALGLDGVVPHSGLADFAEMRFPGLGTEVGGINQFADGSIFEQRYTGGRVVAHVELSRDPATYIVPPGMQLYVPSGGGIYPATSAVEWRPVPPGPYVLAPPANPMPPNSAMILRHAP